MSISGISSGLESIKQTFEQLRSGGISKEDITRLQEQIDDSELDAGLSEFASVFDTIDLDGSGKLDESELKTYAKQAGMRPPPPQGGQPMGEPPALSQEEMTQMAEETGDSALSVTASSFDEADTDKDGKVSHSEFQAFVEAKGLTLQRPESPQGIGVSQPGSDEEEEQSVTTKSSQISSKAFQAILRAYWSSNFEVDSGTALSSTKVEA